MNMEKVTLYCVNLMWGLLFMSVILWNRGNKGETINTLMAMIFVLHMREIFFFIFTSCLKII